MTTAPGSPGSCSMSELRRIDDTLWEIPSEARPDMRVPARLFADEELLAAIRRDRSLEQLAERRDAAGNRRSRARRCLTSTRATAFPSAASRPPSSPDGVISPGGVGYDINCGVRLLALPLSRERARRAPRGARPRARSRRIPAGAGRGGRLDARRRSARPRPRRRAARARVDARDRDRRGRRAHRVERLPRGRRSGGGLRAREAARAATARHGSAPATTSSRCSALRASSTPSRAPRSGFAKDR